MTNLTIVKSCICFPIQAIKVSENFLKALNLTSTMYSYRSDDELRTNDNIPDEYKDSYIDNLYFAWARPHSDIEHEFISIKDFIRNDYGIVINNLTKHNERGFLTSEGKFVDRKQAYLIAKAVNQLYREERSENLYSDNVKF